MADNIRKDNVKGVLKRRVKLKEMMIKHLPFDICSIDAITEFVRDNRKTLYKFNEDSKPFMNAIIKTLNEVEDNNYFYKSKLMFSLESFLSY